MLTRHSWGEETKYADLDHNQLGTLTGDWRMDLRGFAERARGPCTATPGWPRSTASPTASIACWTYRRDSPDPYLSTNFPCNATRTCM
jgi:hypothetical protein